MLIDRFMPSFEVHERHDIVIAAEPEKAYEAALAVDLADSRIVALLFAIRGIPHMLTGKIRPKLSFTFDDLISAGFVVLDEEPGREIALGVVGRFWRLNSGLESISADRFRDFAEPGFAKGVFNFYVEPFGTGSSLLVTETRVQTTDEAARRKFSRYWMLIGPFSKLIRPLMLNVIKREAESH